MGTHERIFHFSDNTSHKFWAVALDDAAQTVRWGRIGTAGQSLTKSFESATDATDATERLIKQKRDKGYVEVSPDDAKRAASRPLATHAPPGQLSLFVPSLGENETVIAAPAPPVAGGLFD